MTTYRPPTKQPCSDCPFRRKAMPGWLGGSSPEGFIDCMNRDEPLPCHQTIDYDDPDWLLKWSAQEAGSMCAGALIFMANKLQRPRAKGFPTLPQNKAAVFANTVEFVRYHREAGTHSWDDDAQNEGAKLQRELIRRGAETTGQPIIDFASVPAKARLMATSGRTPDDRVPLQNIPVRSVLGHQIRREFASDTSTRKTRDLKKKR